MKKSLYASAAVLALVLAAPVMAQPNDKNDENRPRAGQASHDNQPRGEGPERTEPSAPVSPRGTMGGERGTHAPSTMSGTMGPSGTMGTGGTRHHERGTSTMAPTGTMGTTRGTRHRERGTNTMTPTHPGTTAPTGTAGARGAHVHNPKFDSMRRVFTAPRRFQAGAYVRPSGWYQHRWTSGEFLPAFFFVQTYWILDWSDFALVAPPPGTVWVRVGDDAILIDQFTGEVIIVEYGLFF